MRGFWGLFLKQWRALGQAQKHAFFASFLGWMLDSFDYFLLVFSIPAISAEFHAGTPEVAEALFLTLAFRPVGAFLFGLLAERYGRRPALLLNIASYSTLGLLSAFAPTLSSFLVLRALFGVAMGGEWGVGAALAFETLPVEGRGIFSGILQQGYSAGSLLASLAFAMLFPPFSHMHVGAYVVGWRGLFVAGALLPALLTLYIATRVEESPAWKAARFQKKQRGPGVFQSLRQYGGVFLFLVLFMTGFNALSHGSTDLYPTFLIRDHHADARETGFIGIVFNVGAVLGGVLFGSLSERWGRKRAIVTAALLTLPCIPLYALAHSLPALAVGSFLMLFMVQGAWGVVPAYLNELSPGPVRAIFPGLVYQLGNLFASRINVVQAKAAVHVGSLGPILAGTVLVVALFLAGIASLGRETRGIGLEKS